MNNEEIINKTLSYIEENLNKKITLEELSAQSFFSKAHLYRIFSDKVGCSLIEYIRKRRILLAAIDLSETNDSILNIAMKYQFNSQDGFCRAFKKIFGITPIQYRKMSKENKFKEDLFMNNLKNETALSTNNELYNINDNTVKKYIESIKNTETLSMETMLLENITDTLDDLSIQKVLKQLDITELIFAMKGVSGNVQIKIFENLSKRVANFIVNKLNSFDKDNINEIIEAQQKILKEINKL